jgi:L-lactate dehydrogenase complex protein LldE
MKVQLFIPCFIDQLYPQTAFNMVKVLEKACCEVQYNTNQTCCGQPAFNAGFWDESRAVCSKFIRDFEGADYIVAPSASCVGFIRNYYSKIFENSSQHNQVKDLGKRIYEFSEFLTDVLKIENFGAQLNGKATYHYSCAALRECKIKAGPRKLLSFVKGLELLEMEDVA